jgi:hypothetical protein
VKTVFLLLACLLSTPLAWAFKEYNVNSDGTLLVDGADGTFPVTGTVTTESPITGVSDGRKTVAVAGTREVLAGSTAIKKVDITALQANSGVVVVGGTTVIAAAGTRQGVPLRALDTITINTNNLADIWLDVLVSGEGVSFTYYT